MLASLAEMAPRVRREAEGGGSRGPGATVRREPGCKFITSFVKWKSRIVIRRKSGSIAALCVLDTNVEAIGDG